MTEAFVKIQNMALRKTCEMEMIIPNWPAPANVKAFSSTRKQGFSNGVYQGLNLGSHVGDDDHSR